MPFAENKNSEPELWVEAAPFSGKTFPDLSNVMSQSHISLGAACFYIASKGGQFSSPISEEDEKAAARWLCTQIAAGNIEVIGTGIKGAALKPLPLESLAAFVDLSIEFACNDDHWIFESVWNDDARLTIYPPDIGESHDVLENPRDPKNAWFGLKLKTSSFLKIWFFPVEGSPDNDVGPNQLTSVKTLAPSRRKSRKAEPMKLNLLHKIGSGELTVSRLETMTAKEIGKICETDGADNTFLKARDLALADLKSRNNLN